MTKKKIAMKSSKNGVETEHLWQLKELEKDNRFNNWLKRHYSITISELNSKMYDGVIRINSNQVVSAQQMVEYYQQERAIDDRLNEADLSGINQQDLKSQINRRKRIYRATSMIDQVEHLKSLEGLILVSLGSVVAIKLGKKLFQDVLAEQKRQNRKNTHFKIPKLWSKKEVKDLIYQNTKKQNFSKSIWADVDSLKATVDDVISRGVATGLSNQEMAKYLQKEVRKEVSKKVYVTERLARTESAKVEFQVQHLMLSEQGYKYCQWFAEPGACKACREISEDSPTKYGAGIYLLKDVPEIPVHPNCRCSISSYYPENS